MNPILSAMLATREVRGARLHSNVDEETGRFLQSFVVADRPAVSVEVGLAYGTSALFVCDALAAVGAGRHVAFDPMQEQWGDEGVTNLREAGHQDRFTLVPKPAHLGLSAFEEAGSRAGFAFVDGWHTFDHTLVDLFHVDRVLDAGGVLALDDVNIEPVRRAAAYWLTNRAYSLVGSVGSEPPSRKPWQRTAASPVPPGARTIAMRKVRDDDREWNAHVQF